MDAHRLGHSLSRRKRKPRPKRGQRPPAERRRPAGRRPRFRLAAYVARKCEENPALPMDAARIAFTLFIIAASLIAAHVLYRTWAAPETPVVVPAPGSR